MYLKANTTQQTNECNKLMRYVYLGGFTNGCVVTIF